MMMVLLTPELGKGQQGTLSHKYVCRLLLWGFSLFPENTFHFFFRNQIGRMTKNDTNTHTYKRTRVECTGNRIAGTGEWANASPPIH